MFPSESVCGTIRSSSHTYSSDPFFRSLHSLLLVWLSSNNSLSDCPSRGWQSNCHAERDGCFEIVRGSAFPPAGPIIHPECIRKFSLSADSPPQSTPLYQLPRWGRELNPATAGILCRYPSGKLQGQPPRERKPTACASGWRRQQSLLSSFADGFFLDFTHYILLDLG